MIAHDRSDCPAAAVWIDSAPPDVVEIDVAHAGDHVLDGLPAEARVATHHPADERRESEPGGHRRQRDRLRADLARPPIEVTPGAPGRNARASRYDDDASWRST